MADTVGPWDQELEQVDQVITVDNLGVVKGTLVVTMDFEAAVAWALNQDTHPDYPWLERIRGSVSRQEVGIGLIRLEFEGIPPEYDSGKKYDVKVRGANTTEPIETHPNFEAFGGHDQESADTAGYGAIYSTSGKFIGFKPLPPGSDAVDFNTVKAGVKSFKSPGMTVTTETVYRADDAGQHLEYGRFLGQIVDLPQYLYDTVVPTPQSEGRNWLMDAFEVSYVGETGVKIMVTYRLSGWRGWDRDIYTENALTAQEE